MVSLLSRGGVRRVLVLPLFLAGLGACRLLLGIDDPGPAPGEADAAPNDGALPTDGSTPDVLTDAGGDDGGLDGGGLCSKPLVSESFTGDASYSAFTDVDGGGGGLKVSSSGVLVTVGTGTGQAHSASIKFSDLRAGDWKTGILEVDLTLGACGVNEECVGGQCSNGSCVVNDAAAVPVTDTLMLLTTLGAKGVGLQRTTTTAQTFRFLESTEPTVDIPKKERVRLSYTFASGTGDASVARIVVTRVDGGSAEYSDPKMRRFEFPQTDSGLELSIGAFGVSAPAGLSYTIHKVSLCVQ
jgi:hypothetical protein